LPTDTIAPSQPSRLNWRIGTASGKERGGSPTFGVGGRQVHKKSFWNLYSGLKINAQHSELGPGRADAEVRFTGLHRMICDFRHPLAHLAPRPHLCTTSCFHTSPQCISRSVCSATRLCQECGNHTTMRCAELAGRQFMVPLRLDEEFGCAVPELLDPCGENALSPLSLASYGHAPTMWRPETGKKHSS
jgi:hypothetical protein